MRVSACVAVREAASVTWTMNVELPAAVGVPDSVPLLLRLSPAGRVPEVTVQVIGRGATARGELPAVTRANRRCRKRGGRDAERRPDLQSQRPGG